MNKIRVSIDATPLLLRSAGVKTYVYYWTQALGRWAGENSISLFPFLDRLPNLAHETSAAGTVSTLGRLALLHAANLIPYPILNWLAPRADVFHASHQLQHPPRHTRLTSTIYDMTCWLMPELHSAANVKASHRVAQHIFRRADALIAISDSTCADAVRLLGVAPQKIEVIYPGVADAFFQATAPFGRETAARYALVKPYVLYVGTVEPRKNLPALLDAWQQLAADLRAAFDLVIAGSWGWGDRTALERLRAGAPGIRYLGYVPEQDLPAVTAGATVFAYPSLYEGFGLPLAQAMAAGVPSLTSNVSSLPEVAGDAALLIDPRSRNEIRAALERLLLSPSLCSALSARGRERARRFTWETCAQKSWQLFARLVQ